jgi:hypothetical protein
MFIAETEQKQWMKDKYDLYKVRDHFQFAYICGSWSFTNRARFLPHTQKK